MAKFMLYVFYHNQKNFLNIRQCARELDGAGRGLEDDSEGLPVLPGDDAKHCGGAVRWRHHMVKALLLFIFWEENSTV